MSGEFKLKIFDQEIPIDLNPKYLGATLDRTVNLSKHIETIRTRGIEKLNVLRSLSYKNWSLGASQQLTVYKSLIRSCLEYAAPVTIVNQQNIDRLSGVQYRALKIIAKEATIALVNFYVIFFKFNR